MRFVILNHCYEDFLNWLYSQFPGLEQTSFQAQCQAYYATLFGSSDFWAHGLRSLGHEVDEIVCNNARSQNAWLMEHPKARERLRRNRVVRTVEASNRLRMLWRRFSVYPNKGRLQSEVIQPFEVVLEQVHSLKPDVLYIQSVFAFSSGELRALKGNSGVLVGEHAAMPLPEMIDYRLYDMIVSSFPPTIDWLRARGVRAELNRLAFDPRVAALVPETTRDIRVSFAGSFLPVHQSRLELIEAIAGAVADLAVHGSYNGALSPSSALARNIKPALWGRDMYALLRRSMITLNHHGDVPPFANNMRLYEATGMGCLLVTDYKDNLFEMFEPDREVIGYRGATECVDKVLFYLDDRNQSTREKIARAGQRRTLSEHTYEARMRRLVELIRTI